MSILCKHQLKEPLIALIGQISMQREQYVQPSKFIDRSFWIKLITFGGHTARHAPHESQISGNIFM